MCPITTRHRLGVVVFFFYSLQESDASQFGSLSPLAFFPSALEAAAAAAAATGHPPSHPPSAPTSILRRPASQVHGSTTARKPTSNGELVDFQVLKGTAVPFYCGRRSRWKQRELSRKTRLQRWPPAGTASSARANFFQKGHKGRQNFALPDEETPQESEKPPLDIVGLLYAHTHLESETTVMSQRGSDSPPGHSPHFLRIHLQAY